MHALHLCATVPNVRIMEIDIDDVPWKDDLANGPLEIVEGKLKVPRPPAGASNSTSSWRGKKSGSPAAAPATSRSADPVPASHAHRQIARARSIRNRNSGVPITAVSTPSGSSAGAAIVRAPKSAPSTSIAPASALAGSSRR